MNTRSMNRRGDDDAGAECGAADDDGERDIFLLDELLPQVVGRDLVHDDEAEDEDADAQQGVDDGVEEDGGVQVVCVGLMSGL